MMLPASSGFSRSSSSVKMRPCLRSSRIDSGKPRRSTAIRRNDSALPKCATSSRHPGSGGRRGAHVLRPVDVDVDGLMRLRQQEDSIERAAREREEVPPQIAPARRPIEHAPQIVARRGACGRTREHEVRDDGIQQRPHDGAAQPRGQPDDQPDHRRRGSFLVTAPVLHDTGSTPRTNDPSKATDETPAPRKLARILEDSSGVNSMRSSTRSSGNTR